MRIFFAIKLPPQTYKELRLITKAISKSLGERLSIFRWIPQENLHITLKFIGEIQDKKLPLVADIGKEVALSCSTLTVRSSNVIPLPSPQKIRLLALAFQRIPSLDSLVKTLNASLQKMGIPSEKRDFLPHATLARVKRGKTLPNIDLSRDIPPITFEASEIILFKSDLSPDGARYSPLYTFPLKSPINRQ
ncbi:MAG: RNA 2',3'-cyclic phosphodiesterase [Candidatus Dadabacteria bacterium]|nr:MAG: RNA 2',3'-cyclic phosphodiesterase [Candidatus Dadabacteria bacterium]